MFHLIFILLIILQKSLHNKLNLYLLNKKITNSNFILSIGNVILNYEIEKEKIIR